MPLKLGIYAYGDQMTSATIKLFLPRGDARSLRTAEISNWTGKAVAAPRTEIDELLAREELDKAGVYMLIGNDPMTNAPRAYIGEAEIIRERLKQHKTKEFWVSAIVFVSKDENLTKAHVRYLESRLLAEAAAASRFTLEQNQAGGAKLPESDREDMEVFLARIRQLLPVLGSDILSPIGQITAKTPPGGVLYNRIKGAVARGQRTASGFVVFRGSTAVPNERPSAENYPYLLAQRKQLIAEGVLVQKNNLLVLMMIAASTEVCLLHSPAYHEGERLPGERVSMRADEHCKGAGGEAFPEDLLDVVQSVEALSAGRHVPVPLRSVRPSHDEIEIILQPLSGRVRPHEGHLEG